MRASTRLKSDAGTRQNSKFYMLNTGLPKTVESSQLRFDRCTLICLSLVELLARESPKSSMPSYFLFPWSRVGSLPLLVEREEFP